mmetsp:Transcript_8295/g.10870  ORF Transcript_8295/g.10870 Transcript_8295/m.10870 type:complete len:281 (+) Transcript_8295:117-959(+)
MECATVANSGRENSSWHNNSDTPCVVAKKAARGHPKKLVTRTFSNGRSIANLQERKPSARKDWNRGTPRAPLGPFTPTHFDTILTGDWHHGEEKKDDDFSHMNEKDTTEERHQEQLYSQRHINSAIVLQKYIRCWLLRFHFQRLKQRSIVVEPTIRRCQDQLLYNRQRKAATHIQQKWRCVLQVRGVRILKDTCQLELKAAVRRKDYVRASKDVCLKGLRMAVLRRQAIHRLRLAVMVEIVERAIEAQRDTDEDEDFTIFEGLQLLHDRFLLLGGCTWST